MGKLLVIAVLLSAISLAQGQDCPPNSFYVDEYGACIHPDNDASPMGYAELYCQAFGGHLLSINSSFINSMFAGIQLTSLTQKRGFLGLRKAANATYLWSDGTPNDFAQWAPGEPSRGDCVSLDSNDKQWRSNWNTGEPRYDCGSIEKKTAKWTSVDCTTTLPFMCNIPAILNGGCTTSAPPETTQGTPPTMSPLTCNPPSSQDLYSCYNGWQYFPTTDSSYLVGFNYSYTPAEAYCQNQNAHLASVHSASESMFIGDLCCTTDCRHRSFGDYAGGFIVGAKKQNQNWVWSDGTPFDYQPAICPETQGSILWILSDNCGDCKGPGDWDYTDTDDAFGVPASIHDTEAVDGRDLPDKVHPKN
ncbi:unnamed protein product, partial [Mesorhabditis belari]|uniref:C-type lectin domain-containing protein n=1 Tax=Mesorhabditis belari TaxID=2138241 RepID=A0AAF3EID8_9BILA